MKQALRRGAIFTENAIGSGPFHFLSKAKKGQVIRIFLGLSNVSRVLMTFSELVPISSTKARVEKKSLFLDYYALKVHFRNLLLAKRKFPLKISFSAR